MPNFINSGCSRKLFDGKEVEGLVRVRFNIYFCFVLLGLLVSYNLDFECLFDPGENGVCQQVCEDSTNDICAEPSFGSPPAVALPPRPYTFQEFIEQECVRPTLTEQESIRPPRPNLVSSVGLRAPPRFST